MAGRALNVARIQRVVNTCWLSESLGQLPASAQWRGERGRSRVVGREPERRKGKSVCLCEGKRENACHHRGPVFHQQLIRALRRSHEDFRRWTNGAFCPQTSGCQPRSFGLRLERGKKKQYGLRGRKICFYVHVIKNRACLSHCLYVSIKSSGAIPSWKPSQLLTYIDLALRHLSSVEQKDNI